MTQQGAKRIRLDHLALVLAAILAVGALGYRTLGNGLASHSPAAPVIAADTPETVTALEKLAADHPADAGAWRKLGAAYYDAQDFANAARAYEKVATLSPDDASAWSALGEARVMASAHDPMPPEAAAAFEKAAALDPKDPRARYFLAVRKDLAADHQGAIADWLALLADTPADAPWHDDLVRTIEQVGKINKIDVAGRIALAQTKAPGPAASAQAESMPLAAQAIPGPTQQDIAQASAMRPAEQQAMAEGMVERLAARLKSDPANLDGWVMLMRSRVTLNQRDKAAAALADAIAANPGKSDYLRQQAGILGIR